VTHVEKPGTAESAVDNKNTKIINKTPKVNCNIALHLQWHKTINKLSADTKMIHTACVYLK